ncbi:DUF3265 domain-containing protein [Vibrio vulnificus]|nr:DUF3265 domain-containing protein [Vibrio vulnificus]EKA7343522.1 DUF3265 domain-containing protein [Vibrio vulnificus]EKD9327930.1 DUF3265 domain-containing protein [Vibrio vulnificus]ELQ2342524.1 DUF3265 domain-containing protein [Vibrio vulnificus]
MTRRLRGIHAAWHFGFAVGFGGESGLRKLGLCGTHPLTQRYATQVNLGVQSFGISPVIRFELSANEHFYPQIHG